MTEVQFVTKAHHFVSLGRTFVFYEIPPLSHALLKSCLQSRGWFEGHAQISVAFAFLVGARW